MNEDGTMARLPQLREFASIHGLKIISVADLVRYRITKGSPGTSRSRNCSPHRLWKVSRESLSRIL
jgi:hypothetical protein